MTDTKESAYELEARLVVRRIYDAPRERTFRAWVDTADLGKWYTPDDAWPPKITAHDLRHGGRLVVEFGEKGQSPYVESNEYLEIAPPARLVFLSHLTKDDEMITLTRVTAAFRDLGGRTEVTVTEEGVPKEERPDRAGGWAATLANLDKVFA